MQWPTSPRHQPDIGPAFTQQCREFDGRRTAADDRNIAAAEARELRVVSAMREKLTRQGGKRSRHITEVVETDCNEEASDGQNLAILKREIEPIHASFDRENGSLLDLRHEAFLEGETIRKETVQRNCRDRVIGKSVVDAKSFQGEGGRGSDRLLAKPSDFRRMPMGICVRQLCIGRPKMRKSMPRARKWLATERP